MATRTKTPLLAALAALAAAGPASAKVYLEWKPRMSLLAGYNDNVPLDGTGGDGFAQARPGIRLDIFGDHQFHIDVDCQAGVGRLLHPDRFAVDGGAFASSEQCIANYRDRYSPRTTAHFMVRGLYARDPFALSGMGLLLRAGQTQIFSSHLTAEIEHAVSTRGKWEFGLHSRLLAFGTDDPGNGAVFTPSIGYSYRTSPYDTVTFTAREQLFYAFGASPQDSAPSGVAAGIVSQGHAALLTYHRRLRPWATLELTGGGLYMTGLAGGNLMPVARLQLEAATPRMAAHLVLAHDAVIGASRGGPLVGDVAEAAVLSRIGDFSYGLHAGVYRNAEVPSQFTALGSAGYTAEASLDYHLNREWTFGVAALRDARLTDVDASRQVDRNVVQMRLTWERFRAF
jgi:hypothetical protein